VVDYASEEEQIEAIRRWWHDNGRAVLLGVAIGLAALGGWRGWAWYQSEQGIAASRIYQEMLAQVGQGDAKAVYERAERLRDEYSRTPYATLAALAAGRAAAEADQPERAAEWLRWAVDNGRHAQLQHLARARLARVLVAQQAHAQALDTLDGEAPAEYEVLYAEIRGDALRHQGKPSEAASAYRDALEAQGRPADPELLQRKLNQVQSAHEGGDNNGASQS
jgi:predicted negative regulator of RcsB-dependent stress response